MRSSSKHTQLNCSSGEYCHSTATLLQIESSPFNFNTNSNLETHPAINYEEKKKERSINKMSTRPQPKDTDTMSTASTLIPPPSDPQTATRTTLTGRPIKYEHDNLSNLNSGGLGINSHVGANTLPPDYTDDSLVHIPIKTSQYLHDDTTPASAAPPSEIKREKSSGVWGRISKKIAGSHDGGKDGGDGGLKVVAMSRGDYLKYWAKGDDGKFKPGVVEPEEGRAEWLARALERQEREGLGKVTPQRVQDTEWSAVAIGAVGAMMGSTPH